MSKVINKAAVIGAGVMGGGIAALLAGAGISVTLLDIIPPAGLTDADKAAGLTEESPKFRNKFALGGYDRIKNPKMGMLFEKSQIANITVGNMTDDLDKLKDCDWVIEVALEKLEVKKDIMKKVYAHCGPDTIISTNTSGVSINKIAEDMPEDFKKRFLGTHFFNPPRYMQLFEMIPLKETDKEVIDLVADFAEKELGKTVVKAKDTPNFIANRIGVYVIINSMQIMEKYGFNIPTVDLLCGPVMGRAKSASFRTADVVGLDIFDNVSNNVLVNCDDPAEQTLYALPWFVKDRIAAGALGNKTKQGFFKREIIDGKKVNLVFDLESKTYMPLESENFASVKEALKSENKYASMVYGDGPENKYAWENIKSSLLYAARLYPEIADDYKDIDNALVAGFNWEIGLFKIWDKIGVEKSVARMKEEGDEIPAWVEDRLKNGQTTFYEEECTAGGYLNLHTGNKNVVFENEGASLHDIGDGVLCLEFHTKGNSLGEPTMDMMLRSAEELAKDKWSGLVIGNEGKNFCAGADLGLIASLIQSGEWTKLEALIGKLQSSTMAMKYAVKPVVAAPFGSAVGGGAEVLMHTAAATPFVETYAGLVEPGVGLVPAGGGCTEILARVCDRSSEKTKTALLPIVKKTWKMIANGVTSTSAFDAIDKGFMSRGTHVVFKRDAVLTQAKKQVLELAGWGYHPLTPVSIPVIGAFGRAAIQYDIESMEAGNFMSAHDAKIAKKLANILTGGNVPCVSFVPEQHILNLEKEAFLSLCGEELTQARIKAMLTTGRPLRN